MSESMRHSACEAAVRFPTGPSSPLRAAHVLRDWLRPISDGTAPIDSLQLSGRVALPIQRGQCRLDALEIRQFVEQPWWQDFHAFMSSMIEEDAGSADAEKLITSNLDWALLS